VNKNDKTGCNFRNLDRFTAANGCASVAFTQQQVNEEFANHEHKILPFPCHPYPYLYLRQKNDIRQNVSDINPQNHGAIP